MTISEKEKLISNVDLPFWCSFRVFIPFYLFLKKESYLMPQLQKRFFISARGNSHKFNLFAAYRQFYYFLEYISPHIFLDDNFSLVKFII